MNKVRGYLIGLFILAALFGVLFPAFVRLHESKNIVSPDGVASHTVAIVFGAGLTPSGEPSDALRDRLSVAADLYHAQSVEVIFVSGDNRFEDYDEPTAMREALMEDFAIPEEVIVVDYAGRRTYDTCARAHELWGVDSAILVSQAFHLPRALWTCSRLGIEGIGVSASLRSYLKDGTFALREWFATYKTAIDLYLIAPEYVGGDVLLDIDP